MRFSCLRNNVLGLMEVLKVGVLNLKIRHQCKINSVIHFVYFLTIFKTLKQLLHAFIHATGGFSDFNALFKALTKS